MSKEEEHIQRIYKEDSKYKRNVILMIVIGIVLSIIFGASTNSLIFMMCYVFIIQTPALIAIYLCGRSQRFVDINVCKYGTVKYGFITFTDIKYPDDLQKSSSEIIKVHYFDKLGKLTESKVMDTNQRHTNTYKTGEVVLIKELEHNTYVIGDKSEPCVDENLKNAVDDFIDRQKQKELEQYVKSKNIAGKTTETLLFYIALIATIVGVVGLLYLGIYMMEILLFLIAAIVGSICIIITFVIGTKDIRKDLKVQARGIKRTAFILNTVSTSVMDIEEATRYHSVGLKVAYLDDNEDLKIGTVETFNEEIKDWYKVGECITVSEYRGDITLMCNTSYPCDDEVLQNEVDYYCAMQIKNGEQNGRK